MESEDNYYYDEKGRTQYDIKHRYRPRHFFPPLRFFKIPVECPEDVQRHLERAFSATWGDTASAANCLRVALEAILNDHGVPRTTLSKQRKRTWLPLNNRIDKFEKNAKSHGHHMEALKWLGNVGSHAGEEEPPLDQLLDGFRVFEHLIEILYVQKSETVEGIARRMALRKGRPDRVRAAKVGAD